MSRRPVGVGVAEGALTGEGDSPHLTALGVDSR